MFFYQGNGMRRIKYYEAIEVTAKGYSVRFVARKRNRLSGVHSFIKFFYVAFSLQDYDCFYGNLAVVVSIHSNRLGYFPSDYCAKTRAHNIFVD